jgi:hypothetical protein
MHIRDPSGYRALCYNRNPAWNEHCPWSGAERADVSRAVAVLTTRKTRGECRRNDVKGLPLWQSLWEGQERWVLMTGYRKLY